MIWRFKVPRWLIKAASCALYATYFIAGTGALWAESPSLIEFTGSMLLYDSWAGLFFIGSGTLLVGMAAGKEYIEVIGTLPTAFALIVYSLALLLTPPDGQLALAITLGGIIGANSWWLFIRFIVIWPNLGKRTTITELKG
jgi:hypothetical protein